MPDDAPAAIGQWCFGEECDKSALDGNAVGRLAARSGETCGLKKGDVLAERQPQRFRRLKDVRPVDWVAREQARVCVGDRASPGEDGESQ